GQPLGPPGQCEILFGGYVNYSFGVVERPLYYVPVLVEQLKPDAVLTRRQPGDESRRPVGKRYRSDFLTRILLRYRILRLVSVRAELDVIKVKVEQYLFSVLPHIIALRPAVDYGWRRLVEEEFALFLADVEVKYLGRVRRLNVLVVRPAREDDARV